MKYALYHQTGKAPVKLEILNEREDGIVDLGIKGKVIVSECVVVEVPEVGSCTLLTDDEAKQAAKELRYKANELKRQADAAAKAAKAAEGKANHAELAKAASDAASKATQADKDADQAEAAAK